MNNKIVLYGVSFGVQFVLSIAITVLSVHYYSTSVAIKLFYTLNIVTFLTMFISLGIPQALIRYQYIDGVDKKELNKTVAIVGLIGTVLSVFITILLADYQAIFLVLLLPFTVAQYYLRSIEDFKKFIVLYALRFLFVIIGALFVLFFNTHNSFWWYVVVGLSYISGVWYYPSLGNFRINIPLLKDLLKFSIPLQLYSFLLQGVFLIGQTVLEKFGLAGDFDEYVITWRLIQILQGLSALVFFFYPQYYFKYIETNPKQVIKVQNMIILSLVIISMGILIVKPLLDIIFKFDFNYTLLSLLLLSEIFRLTAGVINTKLSYFMKNNYLFFTLLINVAVLLVFYLVNFLVTDKIGVMTVAVGMLSCFFGYFLISYFLCRKFDIKQVKSL